MNETPIRQRWALADLKPHLARHTRPARGVVVVYVALLMTILMGLVGSGVDYGFLVLENTRIQHAVDAAGLAAARSLFSGANPGVTSAQNTATTYLQQHGYQSDSRTTVTMTFSSSLGTSTMDTIDLRVTRQQGMFFWRAIGLNNVPIQRRAVVTAGGSIYDVVVSVDETGSMSNEDIQQLRDALTTFVDRLFPASGGASNSLLGMAQFQGEVCSGSPSVCLRDAHVLQELTNDRTRLLKITNGPGGGCPALPAQPPGFTSAPAAHRLRLRPEGRWWQRDLRKERL